MNAYYLIDASKLEEVQKYAPATGLPHQLFQFRISPDRTKAIVQAEWSEEGIAWLNKNGTFLGELQPDGSAPPAVFEETAKPEWQYPEK